MGKDLFACDLETITFADFEAFVDQKLEEGTRVDYKTTISESLQDAVTAFSNTFGGLLLIGVNKNNRTPTDVTGVKRLSKSDIKTQIANKIITTIYPRPDFSIRVIPHETKPDHDVAVVRVEQGGEPPYLIIQGKRKVSIRVEDQNEFASLADLERLFARRPSGPHPQFADEDRDLYVTESHDGDSRPPTRSNTAFTCWAWPSEPLALRIDHRVDVMFRDLIAEAFPHFKGIAISDRHGTWVDVAFSSSSVRNLSARWRLTSNGSIGFVLQPYHSTQGAVLLADVVYDAAHFIAGALLFLHRIKWEGRVTLQALMTTENHAILATNGDGTAALDGLLSIGERSHHRRSPGWVQSFPTLNSVTVSSFLADHLIDTLRTERRADIQYEQLLASIHRIIGEPMPK